MSGKNKKIACCQIQRCMVYYFRIKKYTRGLICKIVPLTEICSMAAFFTAISLTGVLQS